MNSKILILLLFLSISCAHNQVNKEAVSDLIVEVAHVETEYEKVSPGHLLFFKYKFNKQINSIKCSEKEIPFEYKNNQLIFYWAESYFSTSKSHICRVYSQGEILKKIQISVVPYEYASEQLTVNKRRVSVNTKDQLRARKEREFLNRIYSSSSKSSYAIKPFIVPLESFITSHFGKRRVFNGVRKTQHLGVDLRARTGTSIPTSQRGRVVFAGELFYSGNTVIIDHGLGVFTTYGHLSKIKTRIGAFVGQDQVIGLAGSTGRVNGPHLHWGVKVHGHWVDGMVLVEQTKNL